MSQQSADKNNNNNGNKKNEDNNKEKRESCGLLVKWKLIGYTNSVANYFAQLKQIVCNRYKKKKMLIPIPRVSSSSQYKDKPTRTGKDSTSVFVLLCLLLYVSPLAGHTGLVWPHATFPHIIIHVKLAPVFQFSSLDPRLWSVGCFHLGRQTRV